MSKLPTVVDHDSGDMFQVDESNFPIRVQFVRSGEIRLVNTPEDLPIAEAFKVLKTNARDEPA